MAAIDMAPPLPSAAARRWPWRALVLPALLIAAWIAFEPLYEGASSLLVAPGVVLATAASGIADGSIPGALGATLLRALTGWGIGVAAGLLLGVAIGLSRAARLIVDPTVSALRQIALFAWIPLLSAWLGNGEGMKITLIALGAFFPMALAVSAGCLTVPEPYREIGRALELDRRTTITRIILPAAAPAILAGLELSLNVAWLGTIGAEYLIGTGYINGMGDGIGAYLAAAREYARMDQVLIGVVLLAVVGLALDRSIVHLSHKAAPWHSR